MFGKRSLPSLLLVMATPHLAVALQQPVSKQIAEAVSALPEAYRGEAAVLGYRDGATLELIREGTNKYVCLADTPGNSGFQVTCYQKELEPFMERGRVLRAEGKSTAELRAIRGEEVKAGTLPLPDRAVLVSLFGASNEDTGIPDSVTSLHVIYLPYATPEEVGLPAQPSGGPWLMDAGQHRAHIMISGPARPFTPHGSKGRKSSSNPQR